MFKGKVANYFLTPRGLGDEILVWGQMFFEDGSVTQGCHFPVSLYDDDKHIEVVARKFLDDTHRKTGVLLLWGAGRVMARRCVINKYNAFIQKKLST